MQAADWPATNHCMNEKQHVTCSWLHITHVLVLNLTVFYGQTKNSKLNQIQVV
jgi:hypothetical protein